MYLEIYAELVKLVFDRELTLEPPRNPDGSVKPVADGILGGPHTLDGFLDMAKAAGATRKYVPITWESDRVGADYGHVNLDVIVEDTLVRMVGSTPSPASWLGIVDVPDGQYRLEHGLLATEDDGGTPPKVTTVALPAVNGFEQRLKDMTLKQQDRQRIEAELKLFMDQIGQRVTVKPVTYRNPQTHQVEPGAEVFLEGNSEPLCSISREHVSAVTRELTGILVSNGKYSLKALCPLVGRDQPVAPPRPTVVKDVPIKDVPIHAAKHPLPQPRQVLSLDVVNGWQYKLNRGTATQGELDTWKAKAGSAAIVRRTTFVRNGVSEPAVAVYLDGQEEQFGWIAKTYIPAVTQELHGHLARNSAYTLAFICEA